MTQNTTHAVMGQRHEPRDSLDYFPTPPWAVRALVEHVLIGGGWGAHQIPTMTCWEPACGEGHMARPLREYFAEVHASDCHAYGHGQVHDFLTPGRPLHRPDFVITNPPFRLAAEFIERGLGIATQGVAMLVRSTFLEGVGRWARLYSSRPPAIVAPFAERVPMIKGRLDRAASSATAYSWLVWRADGQWRPATVRWIPPCRRGLERDDDYSADEVMQ